MKRFLIFLLVIIILIGLWFLKTFWQSGGFRTIENIEFGKCQKIQLAGVEDITIDQATGIAFLSSEDRWAAVLHGKPKKGGIFTLDLKDKSAQLTNPMHDFPHVDFHPHGISFIQTEGGQKLLFVINHKKTEDVVERFEFRNDTLFYLETIADPLLISPNDLVAVGERSFYFTNDHNEKNSASRTFKDMLLIGTGNVGFYDGQTMRITQVQGLKYANGINVSPDGQKLYVAASTAQYIYIFDRDEKTGELSKNAEIYTGTGVDNIEVDDAGDLWVGCHPKMLKFLAHAGDESTLAPSEILHIKLRDNYKQQTMYLNDGSELSASAVGAFYRNKLLIGPVFQRHFLLCEN